MTDKERRDNRFLKLCKWMSEAREIAKILREHALRPLAGMARGRGGRK